MKKFVCLSCHKEKIITSKRSDEQSFCKGSPCQRARKAAWKRKKLAIDLEYKSTQSLSNKKWQKNNPNYWREYRKRNPDIVRKNILLQKSRNMKRKAVKRGSEVS